MNLEQSDTSEFVRVLLCDDQAIVGEAVRRIISELKDASYHFVQNSSDLVQEAINFKPTVVLQDLVMPNCSGIDLVKVLRDNPQTKEIPIILLSSNDDSKTKFDAFEAGASDYVVKFPENFELLGRIRYHARAYTSLIERQNAEKMLAQKGRLESLGTLAAGIAHEINTPLQYIDANLSYIQDDLRQKGVVLSEDALAAIEDTISGVKEIFEIVRAMKAFAHPGSEDLVATQVNEIVRDVVTLSKNEWRDCAEIVFELADDLAVINSMPSSLAQALLNIVVNAAHAIQAKAQQSDFAGKITISTKNLDDYILIEISDNGSGMPDQVKARIFDPFFTTKSIGKGSGQGLTLARTTIVDALKGSLNCESVMHKGTSFSIKLPR